MANDIYIIEKIKFVSYQKHILGYKQYLIANKSLLILMVQFQYRYCSEGSPWYFATRPIEQYWFG